MYQIFGVLWGITLLYVYPKCGMTAEICRIRRAARQAIRSGFNLIEIGVNTVFSSSAKLPTFLSLRSNLQPWFKVWLCFFLPWVHKINHWCIIFCNNSQCRRYDGARGAVATVGPGAPFPPNDCLCPPFRFAQNAFLEHHVTTIQQTIMEKRIIIFKHNSRSKFFRLFAKLLATNWCTYMWPNNPSY